jgi:hypothetical protein
MTSKDWPHYTRQLQEVLRDIRSEMADAHPKAKTWLTFATANIGRAIQDMTWATLTQAATDTIRKDPQDPNPNPNHTSNPPSSTPKESSDNFPNDTTDNTTPTTTNDTHLPLSDGTDRARSKEGTERAPS